MDGTNTTNANSGEKVGNEQERRKADENHYTMTISRQTIDKLGVKLYDRASAVVAELVANAYDADAETVCVQLPLAHLLGNADDQFEHDTESIIVTDDGHGMDPNEADRHFLTVGQNRRENREQGSLSRLKSRRVTGRKGIGKLAPFGICNRIEVLSAGGDETEDGYRISHFILDYDEIIQSTDKPYYPDRGDCDRKYAMQSGTQVILRRFQRKRIPNMETFLRQLARRFGGGQSDFQIEVKDANDQTHGSNAIVKPVHIPIVESTKIDLSTRPVILEDGGELSVSGWIGMAQKGYKHEELAGIRLYARNKIIGSTRDFGLMSGFTGENTLRSYLVGQIHAEWLDEDDGEDLIKTDRQDILWESDRGVALSKWGQGLLKELGALTRKPRRDNVRGRFLEVANIASLARERYRDESVVECALDLANKIGGFAAEDELADQEYVDGLSEIILTVAPHRALIDAFRTFRDKVDPDESTLDSLNILFDKTRVAEFASYSQIAAERVAVIGELSDFIQNCAPESDLQSLISKAPWLIEPTWNVIAANQSLRSFARAFQTHWRNEHGGDFVVGIGYASKRPDFIALEVGNKLRVVEIKAPKHVFDHEDYERLLNYVLAIRDFFEKNKSYGKDHFNGWQIDLVADDYKLTSPSESQAFEYFRSTGEVVMQTWQDFLLHVERANSMFLEVEHDVL